MISLTSPVRTRAHGWPAGLKLGALCVATVLLFSLDSIWWHLGFLCASVLLYALPGRVFLRSGMRRLWGLWPFVALIFGWHVVIGDVAGGAAICFRMLTAVGLANLVTMTTRLSDMMSVVRVLISPVRWFGIPPRRIELAMALVIRFTPVLALKGEALVAAWRARSPKRAGWRIVIPFAVLAIDDAERVAEALRARGGV
ncbi:energy-coupling factor transporter transmembrane protein EcfT [Sulfitobacter sp. M57]|uniref:energy-coupling factor transporter transmembrane component T family protein n=1 Tax=unclassified Sulfitobacter TaxID=196795 RepID=UPI0023E0A496|nr:MULTISPECIES: energy-coupling factor transporter transmembrane protein EcfT [unclassified Sulfitobacter]MDF3416295.1 energy-coupling factor transporter transmembrane protein EcfT [Sulfitobacter sp. KE5]MDF3423774.1 energy-coupling factor transporter transmembrane protein EcfT [Sulfitobacter sp. KE43]MDF3434841.1 energy-coupling factor transporter transmembrane protein EcfT [Sulfitobacter sp. KE42]MDF3460480.1 energy-coupling factor transporter transmembrane protein EcfT [Sulfitobacter sp. S7